MWTETIATMEDLEYMAFPRPAGGRGNRLVTGRVATVGGLQPPPCRSRTAMVGARHQLLSLAAGAVAVGK